MLRIIGKVGVKGGIRVRNWVSSGDSYLRGSLREIIDLWLSELILRCL